MNIANSNSALVNNSFTSDIQEKICNALGCYRFADTKLSLKIGEVGSFPWDRFQSPVQSVGITRSASVVLPAQNESQHADLAPRRFG